MWHVGFRLMFDTSETNINAIYCVAIQQHCIAYMYVRIIVHIYYFTLVT